MSGVNKKMNYRIHVIPEELERIARDFSTAAEEARNILNQINTLGSNSKEQWEGNKHKKFLEDLPECIKPLNEYIHGLHETSQKIQQTAIQFRNVDE